MTGRFGVFCELTVYFVPTSSEVIVIPFHKCNGTFEIPDRLAPVPTSCTISPPYSSSVIRAQPVRKLSETIDGTSDEVIIRGPGKAFLRMKTEVGVIASELRGVPAQVTASLLPAGADAGIAVDQSLPPNTSTNPNTLAFWKID
jgi:hypothetical protein